MSRDDVSRMAREAGLMDWALYDRDEKLACFAALVLDNDDGPWKAAMIDQLVVSHIYNAEHENDPRKAIQDLLAYHADIAVDPRVSEAAAKLVEQVRAEERESCAAIIQGAATAAANNNDLRGYELLSALGRAIRARGQG